MKRLTEFGATRVARFGWKDDVVALRTFAADAYLNEMGITSPDAPTDRSACARGTTKFGVLLDDDDDPEDETEDDGRADVDKFADFMRALAPPPTRPQSADAQTGHTLDGRAESIEEAVSFHDGQGAAARNAFQGLIPSQRQNVLDFLNTI